MATKTTVNISPKVLTGGLCGLGVAVAEAVTVAVNPHTLAFLGLWEPLALAAVPPLLGQVAAWFKKEQAAEAAVIPPGIAPTIAPENASGATQSEPLGWVGPTPADAPAEQVPAATPAA